MTPLPDNIQPRPENGVPTQFPTSQSRNRSTKPKTAVQTAESPYFVRNSGFPSLLAELALLVRNTNRIRENQATFDTVTELNPTQARALQLIELIPKPA